MVLLKSFMLKTVQCGQITAMLHYNSRSDWSNLEFLEIEEKVIKNNKGNVEDSSFMTSNKRA